jgi:SPP1 family holin
MNITTGTIIRTICLLISLANQILAVFGKSPLPIDDATVEMIVSTVATAIFALIAWWKNNDFTRNARKAGVYLLELKRGEADV